MRVGQDEGVTTLERRRALVNPREHGAWGMLLVPLVTGAAVGLQSGREAWPVMPLTIAAVALFWLRTPVENWMGTVPTKARTEAEVRLVKKAALALAAIAAAALIWLFWGGRNPGVWWLGGAAAIAVVAQALVRQWWRKARTVAQWIGAAGLTAVAPAAYLVVTGQMDWRGWLLWLCNFAFAANQIQCVQLRIRGAHAVSRAERVALGRGFLAAQGVLMALLVAGCAGHVLSGYTAAAFLPILWRGFQWFAAPFRALAVHALGLGEMRQAIVFGVLLSLSFALG